MAFSHETVAGRSGVVGALDASGVRTRLVPSLLAILTVLLAVAFAGQEAQAGSDRRVDVIIEIAEDIPAAEALKQIKAELGGAEISMLPGLRMVTANVSDSDISRLRSLPAIAHLERDEFFAPALAESAATVGAPLAWASGETGVGTAVAVVDTGVDASHPFLDGNVILEACFTRTSCPFGASTAFGPGSAAPCDTPDCTHGTHVAGIIAGQNSTMTGIAPGAKIIAIQVFSMITDERECGSTEPCARARTSDVLAALDYLYRVRNNVPLTAVNLSLSSDDAVSSCNELSLAAAVVRLRDAGVASIAAAGNGSSRTGLGIPACISATISVGATHSSTSSFWALSNSSSELDFWAPGVSIMSSVPGSGFAAASGTSAAAPHVAGAWTIATARLGTNDVDAVLAHLRSTGIQISDSDRRGNTAPLVNVAPSLNVPAAVAVGSVPVTGDFNGDRRDDVLWHAPAGGAHELWLGTSSSNEAFVGESVTTPRADPTVADFNGDGRDDIFWDGPDRANHLWFGQPDGSFETRSSSTSQLFKTFIGDFNGDDRDDIYWNASGPHDWIWFGRSDRKFDAVRASAGDDFEPFTGDFDGDGRDDIFFNRAGPNDWLWYGRADRRFDARRANAGGSHLPRIADFDGNGTDDILWDSVGSNNWVWFTDRSRVIRSVSVPTRADATAILGDFDADRRADVLWNFDGTNDEVWFGESSRTFARTTVAAEGGDTAATGDFNGDLHTDLIWNQSNGRTLWFGQSHRKFLVGRPRLV